MSKKQAKLLWIDLEMTGLDPVEDRIMEVAAIATDWNFEEIATYEAVVKVESELVESRMEVEKNFWAANPESREGLIKQNLDKGKSGKIVESGLIKFVNKYFEAGERVLLAGSSVHQDRRFIRSEWSEFNQKLHYRMLDVSAWKVVFNGKYGKKYAKRGAHRALDDIRGSIEELEYYLKKVKI